MADGYQVIDEAPGLYRVILLPPLRRTRGVHFDAVPVSAFPHVDAIDRLIHAKSALSPGAVGDVERPWYMHPHQQDNLLVLHGTRYVDIYTKEHGRVESFVVGPDVVKHGRKVIHDGPAMLVWPVRVFHRIRSSGTTGSASLNFAVHYPGFDIRTNFNIYDVDTKTGEYRCLREGHLDQPTGD